MSHTPGPWKVKSDYNVFGVGGRLVANSGGHSGSVRPEEIHEENKANARLIAAAPELLEAAKRAQELISSAIDLEYVSGKPGDPAAVIWRELDAAITKAEGHR